MTETATVKVGDTFYRSWGYDQTNVNFYTVTAVSKTGKTATFMEITQAAEHLGSGHDRVTANASAAVCGNCLSAIRPLAKVNGETVWRHVGSGDEQCYPELEARANVKAAPVVVKRRLRTAYGGELAANFNSYSNLYAWDGKDKYQTAQGWGH